MQNHRNDDAQNQNQTSVCDVAGELENRAEDLRRLADKSTRRSSATGGRRGGRFAFYSF